MRFALVLMQPLGLLAAAACSSTHHHWAPNDRGPRGGWTVAAWEAPADRAGFRVTTPSSTYGLASCVVSSAPLGPAAGPLYARMDGPVAILYSGVEIQLCCSACIREFRANPEKYLADVRSAAG